jgi:hypothetical protein
VLGHAPPAALEGGGFASGGPAGVAERHDFLAFGIYKGRPFPVGGLEGGFVPQRTLGAIRMPFASSSGERLT